MKQSYLLRLPEDKMASVKRAAKDNGLSLNEFILRKLDDSLKPKAFSYQYKELVEIILKSSLEKEIKSILLFGSVATGEASASSDLDLLIVLDKRVPIRRSLYQKWQDEIDHYITPAFSSGRIISPHFVSLPDTIGEAQSLWLEIAISGVILWKTDTQIDQWIHVLRTAIASGVFQRKLSHGHPYWIRNDGINIPAL